MKYRITIFVFINLLVASCNGYNFEECEMSPIFDGRRVIVIGIDGLKSDALIKAQTINIDNLITNGKYTYEARIDSTKSFSGPGWSSISTGVDFEKHKVNSNFFVNENFDEYPMLHCLIQEEYPELESNVSSAWDEFDKQLDGCARKGGQGSDDVVEDQVKTAIRNCNINYIFAHFLRVDNRGHNFGFDKDAKEYIAAIEKMDGRVGSIIKGIRAREEQLGEDWLIVLCTDHGGVKIPLGESPDGFLGKHKDYGNLDEVSKVPLVFSNSRIEQKLLNERIEIVDVVPTIIHWLGLQVDPSWALDGKIIELE